MPRPKEPRISDTILDQLLAGADAKTAFDPNELKNCGVEDVLIAIVDGLNGFPKAITAVFPQATVQTCIVHLLRHSLDFVSWKDRKSGGGAQGYQPAVDAAGEADSRASES